MLPDDPVISTDQYGHEMIIVRKHHLEKFSDLISWIRKRGYKCIVKLRLHHDDRKNKDCIKLITQLMKKKFEERAYNNKTKKKFNVYEPDVQQCFRASVTDDVYRYVKSECTPEERSAFVDKATNIDSYDSCIQTCCTASLQLSGPDGARKHCFGVLRQSAPFTHELKEKREMWNKVKNVNETSCNNDVHEGPSVIYGAGMLLDPMKPIKICGQFSMCALDSILDLLEEKYDGIAYPYVYAGTLHSLCPWQIEENGLFSISYLFGGNPKLWFGILPQYFGFVTHICNGFAMDQSNVGCPAVLADHKIIVADPDYFLVNYEVPYDEIVQEEGDFIITLPFASHAGFNLGDNLALAVNFADDDWIEWGMYPPLCNHNKTQVQLNLTNILQKRRSDLLEKYLCATTLAFPKGHPREVQWYKPSHAAEKVKNGKSLMNHMKTTTTIPLGPPCGAEKFRERTLHCPTCHQSFKGNKIDRLNRHIDNKHPADAENLHRIVRAKYDKWKPRTRDGHCCKVCGIFRRGTSTHIRQHHMKDHAHLPYQGAQKQTKAT